MIIKSGQQKTEVKKSCVFGIVSRFRLYSMVFMLTGVGQSHAQLIFLPDETTEYSHTISAVGLASGSQSATFTEDRFPLFDASLGSLAFASIYIEAEFALHGNLGSNIYEADIFGDGNSIPIGPIDYLSDIDFYFNFQSNSSPAFSRLDRGLVHLTETVPGSGIEINATGQFTMEYVYSSIPGQEYAFYDSNCTIQFQGSSSAYCGRPDLFNAEVNVDTFLQNAVLDNDILFNYDLLFRHDGPLVSLSETDISVTSNFSIRTNYWYEGVEPAPENPTIVPEPWSLGLMGFGLLGLMLVRRKDSRDEECGQQQRSIGW